MTSVGCGETYNLSHKELPLYEPSFEVVLYSKWKTSLFSYSTELNHEVCVKGFEGLKGLIVSFMNHVKGFKYGKALINLVSLVTTSDGSEVSMADLQ